MVSFSCGNIEKMMVTHCVIHRVSVAYPLSALIIIIKKVIRTMWQLSWVASTQRLRTVVLILYVYSYIYIYIVGMVSFTAYAYVRTIRIRRQSGARCRGLRSPPTPVSPRRDLFIQTSKQAVTPCYVYKLYMYMYIT